MGRINWPRTRDILICIICVGLIVDRAWSLGALFVDAIVILLLSMAVAFLITPAVNFLTRLHLPRVLAALIVYLLVLAAIGGFGYSVVTTLVAQITQFSDSINTFFKHVPDWYNNVIDFLLKQGISQTDITNVVNTLQKQVGDFASSAASSATSIFSIVVNVFLDIFLILVLSFYLTVDGKRIRDNIVGIIPKRSLPHVMVFEDALNRVVGNYIRGQLTLAAIVGIYVGLVCVITGLSGYALIVGLLAFLFETIPMVGPALASIPTLALTLLVPGKFPGITIEVAILFVILQVIESNILGPRIVGHAVGLHPVAAILSLLVFAQLFGIFGALLATPIVAAVWVVIVSIYRSARGETADQMLARKRAPWSIRRPNIPSALRTMRRTGSPGEPEGQAERNNGEFYQSDGRYLPRKPQRPPALHPSGTIRRRQPHPENPPPDEEDETGRDESVQIVPVPDGGDTKE